VRQAHADRIATEEEPKVLTEYVVNNHSRYVEKCFDGAVEFSVTILDISRI